ncbi:unnamed protein product [Rotaria sp. Silwood2]|nr:unnamed protein product [Rotaria sp. Silwood2]CAF3157910.1 unnamed protein product [Rotaria sp. Silwood2]CAF4255502.1 unnamed protein product [Rotaria sp. Silwood2]CAF4593937.1 unnamed protein product [Rotaria sp. Silwood2]
MYNKYLLLIGFITIMHISTTNGNATCLCYCCTVADCIPIYRGTVDILSCDGFSCYDRCEKVFPFACDRSKAGEVDARCTEIITTTLTTSSSSTTTSTTLETTTVTIPTENTTATVTTTITSTTATVTVSTTNSPQTSPSSTFTTTQASTLSTTPTQPPITTSKNHGGASILRESPSFIVLIVTSILLIIKAIL